MTAVFWDLDDTLINTVGARMRALEAAYEKCCGARIDGRSLWQAHQGGTLEALAQKILGADYRRFVDAYRSQYYSNPGPIAPYGGVTPVLEALLQSSVPMVVITSKVSWGATDELQRCGLLQYFHSVVGYDDTDVHKPEPDPVFEACDRLMMNEPEGAFFVGDSPADVLSAKNAGCRSIAALWGTLEESMLIDACPDYEAAKPADVLEIIREEVAP